MKISKLDKFETVAAPLIVADTPEELAVFIAELVAIGEKLPSGSVSGESLSDILADYKKPQTVIVQMFDGKRISVCDGVTKIISGAVASESTKTDAPTVTKMDAPTVTKFNDEELRILESLKNG
jgi:hypothetical protein